MNWLQTNYSTKSIFDGGIANCERLRAGVVGHPTEIPHERSMTGDQAPGIKPPAAGVVKEVTEAFL